MVCDPASLSIRGARTKASRQSLYAKVVLAMEYCFGR
jgi:hypothetical protein